MPPASISQILKALAFLLVSVQRLHHRGNYRIPKMEYAADLSNGILTSHGESLNFSLKLTRKSAIENLDCVSDGAGTFWKRCLFLLADFEKGTLTGTFWKRHLAGIVWMLAQILLPSHFSLFSKSASIVWTQSSANVGRRYSTRDLYTGTTKFLYLGATWYFINLPWYFINGGTVETNNILVPWLSANRRNIELTYLI